MFMRIDTPTKIISLSNQKPIDFLVCPTRKELLQCASQWGHTSEYRPAFRVPGTYSMNISNLFVGINDEKVCCQDHPLLQAFFRSTLSNEPTLKPRDGSSVFSRPVCRRAHCLWTSILNCLCPPPVPWAFFCPQNKKPPQGRLFGSYRNVYWSAGRSRPKCA